MNGFEGVEPYIQVTLGMNWYEGTLRAKIYVVSCRHENI